MKDFANQHLKLYRSPIKPQFALWVTAPEATHYTPSKNKDPPLLKLDLGLQPGFALEGRIPEDVLVDDSFVQRNINRVSEHRTTKLFKPSAEMIFLQLVK